MHATDLQRRHALASDIVVTHVDLGGVIARRHCIGIAFSIALGYAGARQGEREYDEFVACVGWDIQRGRCGVGAGQVEGQAVGQHAGSAGERDLAEVQRGAVQHQVQPAPAVAGTCCKARLRLCGDKAVMLLEMLRLEEHALRPDDFVSPCHGI